MKPLRIAHISDTHLGYRALSKADPHTGRNQRSVDIETAFTWAIDDLLKRDVDLVIHSGDLFHQTRPVYPAIGTAIRQFRRLELAGLPTFVIGGNHDTPRLRTSGSVFSILEMALPDIRFFGGYAYEAVDHDELNVSIALVPHGSLTDPETPYIALKRGVRNILVTHGLVPNMDLPYRAHEPGEEEVEETLLDEDFTYIALGHYHLHDNPRKNAWYAGATERIGWGDAGIQPGYAVVELGDPDAEPSVQHIPIPTRPMHAHHVPERVTADNDGARIADHALRWLKELKSPDAMTRVVLPGVARPARRQAESIIRKEAEEYVWSVEVVGKTDLFSTFNERDADLPSIDLLEQFAAFVAAEREAGNYDPAFAEAFAATGRRELEQAMMVLEAQLTTEEA
jgi:DNA repair protein SbcD/Mre11